MTTLTASSSFDAREGSEFATADVSLVEETYSSGYIERTLLIDSLDQYLTYAFTGSFSGAGTHWSGTASKLDFHVNYAKYYSLTGSFDYLGFWGLNANDPFAGADVFAGSDQNDYFVFAGGTGNDKYFGNGGNDYLQTNTGGKGVASGGAGDDFLVGSGKGDTLTGGAGNDVFKMLATGQKEIITDFDSGGDLLEIAVGVKLTAVTAVLGEDASGAFLRPVAGQIAVGSGYKSARDADDLFVCDLKTGNLYFDKDGQGGAKAVQLANLKTKPQLSAGELAACVIVSIVGSTDLPGAAEAFIAANTFGSM